MPESQTKTGPHGWLKRHWGTLTVVAVALLGFLGGYDTFRNKGRLFFCDLMATVGQKDAIPLCRAEEAELDTGDQLNRLEYLKSREGQLTPEKRQLLRRLEAHLEERAFAELTKAAGIEDTPVDVQAKAETREAVRETVEQGGAEERRALDMIADGDVDGGLELLTELASAPAKRNAAQWRRIGRLAYAADTARALDAYEKAVALDPSAPRDSIYLGRLHQRAGDLDAASRSYTDALDRLPESEHRHRSVLLDEIGDVLVAQGNLAPALESYRASHAILERLAEADAGNAGWQHDVALSLQRIGWIAAESGEKDDASRAYHRGLGIMERLVALAPNHAAFRRDRDWFEARIGELGG